MHLIKNKDLKTYSKNVFITINNTFYIQLSHGFQYIYMYQNDKEIKPSYQVLRVLCRRMLQSLAYT